MSASYYLTPKHYFVSATILATSLTTSCLIVVPIASAQVLSDGTVQTQVTPTENQLVITGGREIGTNLFHSFDKFSVPTNFEAYFQNSLNINNIISRVTGGTLSTIEGIIRANGTANLFLINPNGIVFGSNAVVNIGGSFLATSAESLQFADGSQFSATNPQSSPLLTMTAPVGLQFGSNPGIIVNQASSLSVSPNNTLGLVGGDVMFRGGNLRLTQARVELGSVGNNSFVQLTNTNSGFELGYQGVEKFQDISLSQRSTIEANNSAIQIQGRRITINEQARVISTTKSSESAGDVTVNASESLEITDSKTPRARFVSSLLAQVFPQATGQGGNIEINTKRLLLQNGGLISAETFGLGTGGQLQINASESIQLIGTGFFNPSLLSITTSNAGDGGEIMINTKGLILQDGSQITAVTIGEGRGGTITINASELIQVSGQGRVDSRGVEAFSRITTETGFQDLNFPGVAPGGNLNINTNQLIVTDRGSITAGSLGEGQAGNIDITASTIFLDNQGIITASSNGTENAGNVTLNTDQLTLNNQSEVAARSFGFGNGGNLTINANTIFLDNQGVITASSEGTGDAGNINLETNQLTLKNQSEVAVRSIGFGEGGNLDITVETIFLKDQSQLTATSNALEREVVQDLRINPKRLPNDDTIGNAGNLTLNSSSITLNNDSQVTVSSFGSGNAGNIEINAQNLTLDNSSELTAETASGEGGNITLNLADFLTLRHESTISTTAGLETGGGNGGNIDIHAQFMVAVPTENSDIVANAFMGDGGNINITSAGVFGIEERESLTNLSDITASSQFGQVGRIGINRPDVDPQRSLVKLPTEVADGKNLVLQACSPGGAFTRGEFTITGREGLPPSPNQSVQTAPGLTELGYPEIKIPHQLHNPQSSPSSNDSSGLNQRDQSESLPIVEAQGWIIDKNGKVILTAQASTVTSQDSGFMPAPCYDFSTRSLSLSQPFSNSPQRDSMAE